MKNIENFDISDFDVVDVINKPHNVYLVKHSVTQKYYVKKVLDVYNISIYKFLKDHSIAGVPQVYYFSENNDRLTVIEEFVTGSQLSELIEEKSLKASDVADIMLKLCTILEALHYVNPPIIHRDIKPSNIMVDGHGQIYLIDFNASKFYNDEDSDTVLLGTQGYAAPEQYGFAASSPQTDIYALGKVLDQLSSAVSGGIDYSAIIKKCSAMDPLERYQSAADLRAAISEAAGIAPHIKHRRARKSIFKILLNVPGFRSRTPWKMLIASICYMLMIISGISYDSGHKSALWSAIEKIYVTIMMYVMVNFGFNYKDFRFSRPFTRSGSKLLQAVGIFIMEFLILFVAAMISVILEDIFHIK
ncbi:MAG: hypothetical protein DUD27_01375 [Lachnospiraceae bacterium]|uniref:non-specific serine/threonine protein kinase n=1 Tax=Candidatus Weimeria bifida TaxID=2599074 RepID=A0A6N7IX24_9FIRM|nr:protein kinase [Candidatus Weimeria bifida]RRF97240.1 MAG: hypothetical protein DUD27_01375 [Lachnospiraceae bacterium]